MCSYCRRPNNKGRVSYGSHFWSIDVVDYECLLNAGWVRSGMHCYRPSNEKCCCPNLTIRVHSLAFQPTRGQERVLRRMHEYLSGARPIVLPEVVDDVLERCLAMARTGHAREACERVCREKEKGDPLDDSNADGDLDRGDDKDDEQLDDDAARGSDNVSKPSASTSVDSAAARRYALLTSVRGIIAELLGLSSTTPGAPPSIRGDTGSSIAVLNMMKLLTPVATESVVRRVAVSAPSIGRRGTQQSIASGGGSLVRVPGGATRRIDGVCNAAFLIAAAVDASEGDVRPAIAAIIAGAINAAAAATTEGALHYVVAEAGGGGHINLSLDDAWEDGGQVRPIAAAGAFTVSTRFHTNRRVPRALEHIDAAVATKLGLPLLRGNVVTCLNAETPEAAAVLKAHYRRIEDNREAVGRLLFEANEHQPPTFGDSEGSDDDADADNDDAVAAAAADDGSEGACNPATDAAAQEAGRKARRAAAAAARAARTFEKDVTESVEALAAFEAAGIGSYGRRRLEEAIARRSAGTQAGGVSPSLRGDAVRDSPGATTAVGTSGTSTGSLSEVGSDGVRRVVPLPSNAAMPLSDRTMPTQVSPSVEPAAVPQSSLLLPFGAGPHVLTVELVRPKYTLEAHELYARFNMTLHRGRPHDSTVRRYSSHLVQSPLQRIPAGWMGFMYAAATNEVGDVAGTLAASSPTSPRGWFAPFSRFADLAVELGVPSLAPAPDALDLLCAAARERGDVAWLLAVLSRVPASRPVSLEDVLKAVGSSDTTTTENEGGSYTSCIRWLPQDYEGHATPASWLIGALPPLPSAILPLLLQVVVTSRGRLRVPFLTALLGIFVVAVELLDAAEALAKQKRTAAAAAAAAAAADLAAAFAAAEAEEGDAPSPSPLTQQMKTWAWGGAPSSDGEAASPKRMRMATEASASDGAGDLALLHTGRMSPLPFSSTVIAPVQFTAAAVPEFTIPSDFASEAALRGSFDLACWLQRDRFHWLGEAFLRMARAVTTLLKAACAAAAPHDTGILAGEVAGSLPSAALFDRYVSTVADVAHHATASAMLQGQAPRIFVTGWDLRMGYGTFHHEYRLDGALIAVSVLDILPTRVSSVYFFYDTSLRYLELGKLSALLELRLSQRIHMHLRASPSRLGLPRHLNAPLIWWDPNFYVHAVPTMNYKRHFKPAELLCPYLRESHWVAVDDSVLLKLDADPGAPLGRVSYAGTSCDNQESVIRLANEIEEDAADIARMQVGNTLHLINREESYTFNRLSTASRSFLQRGTARFLAVVGPEVGLRVRIDPNSIASIEGRWITYNQRRTERARALAVATMPPSQAGGQEAADQPGADSTTTTTTRADTELGESS